MDLNPHQFGDQLPLFHAPLGQPESGTFQGNPQARLYRAMQVPDWHDTPEAVLQHASQPGVDRGHDRSLGIHWQHDLGEATDLANTAQSNNWGKYGDHGHPVILEADHPGHEHVIDDTPHLSYQNIRGKQMLADAGPPEGARAGYPGNNRLTGYPKDWALLTDTVGPHNVNSMMLPEVPVRPGAPMRIAAVHLPHPTISGEFVRHPVQFRGQA